MYNNEKRIRDLRRRWPGIVCGMIALVMFSTGLALTINRRMKLDALVTPERIAKMKQFEDPKGLPDLLCRFHTLADCSAKVYCDMMVFSVFVGFFLAYIIIQVADLTYRRLIVSMWDRIQHLEEELRDVRNRKEDGEQPRSQ